MKSLTAILIAGIGLGGGVVKSFDTVGARLNADANLAIAVWILDSPTARPVPRWTSTCLALFNIVYGDEHFSRKCFIRSTVISIGTAVVSTVAVFAATPSLDAETLSSPWDYSSMFEVAWPALAYLGFQWCLCDYLILLSTRFFVYRMSRTESTAAWLLLTGTNVIVATALSVLTATTVAIVFYVVCYGCDFFYRVVFAPFALFVTGALSTLFLLPISIVIPVLFTSVWLTLLFCSGVVIKVVLRVAKITNWSRRYLDLENKPVQSLGIVAGGVIAALYCCLASVAALI